MGRELSMINDEMCTRCLDRVGSLTLVFALAREARFVRLSVAHKWHLIDSAPSRYGRSLCNRAWGVDASFRGLDDQPQQATPNSVQFAIQQAWEAFWDLDDMTEAQFFELAASEVLKAFSVEELLEVTNKNAPVLSDGRYLSPGRYAVVRFGGRVRKTGSS